MATKHNTFLFEPVKNLSANMLFEPSPVLNARIKKHGFDSLYEKGYLTVTHDEAGKVVRVDEPVPNLSTAFFEPSPTVRKKIARNGGAKNLISKGWIISLPCCW